MTRGRRRSALALVVGCLSIGHGARAAGPVIAPEGTQPGGLAGATLPAEVASKCSSCHAGGSDEDGKTFRPWDTWSGTMMANATRDPLFLAALTVSEQEAPGSGAYCLRCHTPKGFVKGHATGTGGALDADDHQGVDCEACHRATNASVAQPAIDHDGALIAALAAADPQAPYIGNARLFWDPRDVRHGPYADADSPAHAASGDPFASSSALCGQCHEVLSPLRNLLNGSGADTGYPFPLDTTYTEWLSSDYARPATAKSCIECHMPAARGDALRVSTFPSSLPRANPRMHLFAGGNEWGLDAVKLAAPDIATERSAAFDAAQEATRALLATAVQLDLTPGEARTGATTFDVTVRVTNLTGHKFPTGYADGRRAFLQVALEDAQGNALGLRGRYDDVAAQLDGPSELRVWESVQAEHLPGGGHREWHIARNDTIVRDTRIPPKGFRPEGAAAIAMTASVGADYGPSTAVRNYDDVVAHFVSLPPLPAGSVKVTARVFYQSTTRELIEELARANVTDDRGTRLRQIWEQTGRAAPRLIASKSVDVTLAPPTGAGGQGGGDSGGGCSCELAETRPHGVFPGWALLLVAGWAFRRRRGARSS